MPVVSSDYFFQDTHFGILRHKVLPVWGRLAQRNNHGLKKTRTLCFLIVDRKPLIFHNQNIRAF